MKTIKKSIDEYRSPETREVNWNNVVGNSLLYNFDASGEIIEFKVLDYYLSEKGVFVKYDEMNWRKIRVDHIIAVLSKVDLAEWLKYKKEPNKILEKFRELNDSYKKPTWPNLPLPPIPTLRRCSLCRLEIGGVMGYVCPHLHCPSGFGGTWCSKTKFNPDYKEYMNSDDVQG